MARASARRVMVDQDGMRAIGAAVAALADDPLPQGGEQRIRAVQRPTGALAYHGRHIACYASSAAAPDAATAVSAAGRTAHALLLTPGREWSLTELAARSGASVSSAQREMARAQDAGVTSSRRLGNTRLVRVADSPLTGPLTELMLRSFGPHQVIAEELAGLAGIEEAYLFGSWAAR